jgi:hypothetical protein
MQDIYNYVVEGNSDPKVYNATAIMQLLFMTHITPFPMINIIYFCSSTVPSICAVPNAAVSEVL